MQSFMTRHHEEVDDRLGPLFEPHVVMPEQVFTARVRRTLYRGELRLMCAILDEAIGEYLKCRGGRGRRKQRLFRETSAWLASDDRSWVFSFANICDALDLDPASVRRRLGVDRLDERFFAAAVGRSTFECMAVAG